MPTVRAFAPQYRVETPTAPERAEKHNAPSGVRERLTETREFCVDSNVLIQEIFKQRQSNMKTFVDAKYYVSVKSKN